MEDNQRRKSTRRMPKEEVIDTRHRKVNYTNNPKNINSKNKKGKKRKKKSTFRKVLLCLFLIILIFAGIFTTKVIRNGGGLQGFLSAILGHDETTLKELPKTYCLVLGVSKDISAELTDTIMLCSYDPKTQEAAILSIPRDTFVGKNKNRATGSDKINALYNINKKNPEKTVQAVEKITGIDIPYYVVVDNEALIELVDAIGGVTFNVPIDMDYDDGSQNLSIKLKAGEQRINGEKAEQLLRFRHNNDGTTYPSDYGEQDLGRMRTQREFIEATLKQTLKPQNIFKIGNIVDVVAKNVKTNMTVGKMKDYVPYAVNFSTENLKTGVLPGTPEKCNGVWIYTYNKTETEELVKELFTSTSQEQSDSSTNTTQNTVGNESSEKNNNTTETNNEVKAKKSDIRIEVLNGSSSKSNLSNLTKYLKEKGYNVVKTGNNNSTISKTTIINRTNQPSEISKELKTAVGSGTITTGTKTDSRIDYTIIIGNDYKVKK